MLTKFKYHLKPSYLYINFAERSSNLGLTWASSLVSSITMLASFNFLVSPNLRIFTNLWSLLFDFAHACPTLLSSRPPSLLPCLSSSLPVNLYHSLTDLNVIIDLFWDIFISKNEQRLQLLKYLYFYKVLFFSSTFVIHFYIRQNIKYVSTKWTFWFMFLKFFFTRNYI